MRYLDFTYENLLNLFISLLVVLGCIILGIVLQYVLFKITSLYQRRRHSKLIESYLIRLKYPLYVFTPALIASMATPSISYTLLSNFIASLIRIVLIVSFAWALIKVVYVIEDFLRAKYQIDKADNLRERAIHTQLHFFSRILVILISVISLAILLMSFSGVRELGTGLLASAGVLTAIVGFASQKLLGNILAGFQIACTQPIRFDDVLIVEGEWGRVEEITLTNVVVNIWDQRRLILPISYFIEKPFQNWTRKGSALLGTVFIYTDYKIDIEKIREELYKVVKSTPLWDGRVCVTQVTDATEKTLQIRLLVSSISSPQLWDLRCLVREKILKFIQENYPDSLPKIRFEGLDLEQDATARPIQEASKNV